MKLQRLVLALTLLVSSSYAQEYKILKQFPAGMIYLFHTSLPDARGYQGTQKDQDRIHDAEFQRGGAGLLLYGVLANQPTYIDAGLRTIDATFREEHPDGSIGDNKGYLETGDVLFLQDSLRALRVLEESPFAASYQSRIDAEKAPVERLIHWLSQPQQQQNLYQQEQAAPNRCFAVAVAFARAYRFLGQPAWNSITQKFFDLGMHLYRPSSGVFVEGGGSDTSYQAVNLLVLEYLYFDFGRSAALPPLKKGLAWELSNISSRGEVSAAHNARTGGEERYAGHVKSINYVEVTEMLEMACLGLGNQQACSAATAVFNQRWPGLRPPPIQVPAARPR